MEYGNIHGIDKPVSRLVQGTMMINASDKLGHFRLLDAVVDLGCTTLDTAHVYTNGESERVVGAWLQQRKNRDDLIIIGKGAHHTQDRKRVTPFDITAHIYDILARLKTDYIDIFLLHRDDPDVPVGPIVEVLNAHKAAGRINLFGGSNWSIERIQAANAYAAKHNLTPFVASSPNFSLADQKQSPWPDCISISGPKNESTRQWYAETQIPLFTWSSLAGGFFSGRFTRDNLNSFDDYFDKLCVDVYGTEENLTRLDRVRTLAAEKHLSVPQIALAYVLSQPLNIYALVGCQTGEEFKANTEAAALKLTVEECAWLELKQDER